MKIILADDEDRNRRPLADYLTRRKHMVIEAASGEQAILAFDTNSDAVLVITDLEMEKKKSGLEVLKHVRTASDKVNLCLMSGALTDEVIHEAESLGAITIGKPFGLSELRQKLGV